MRPTMGNLARLEELEMPNKVVTKTYGSVGSRRTGTATTAVGHRQLIRVAQAMRRGVTRHRGAMQVGHSRVAPE